MALLTSTANTVNTVTTVARDMPKISTGGADGWRNIPNDNSSARSGFDKGTTSVSYDVTPREQAALTQDILGSVANLVLRPGFLKKWMSVSPGSHASLLPGRTS